MLFIALTVRQVESGEDAVSLALDQVDSPPQPQMTSWKAAPGLRIGAIARLELKVERYLIFRGRGVGIVECSIEKYGENENEKEEGTGNVVEKGQRTRKGQNKRNRRIKR